MDFKNSLPSQADLLRNALVIEVCMNKKIGGIFLLLFLLLFSSQAIFVYFQHDDWPMLIIMLPLDLLMFILGISSYLSPDIKKLEQKHDVKGLIKALYHPNPILQQAALKALLKLDNPQAVEELVVAIESHTPPKRMSFVRWFQLRESVAQTLARLGHPRAVDLLIIILKEPCPERMAFTKWLQLREAVAQTLAKLGDARSVDLLIAMLKEQNKNIPSSMPKKS